MVDGLYFIESRQENGIAAVLVPNLQKKSYLALACVVEAQSLAGA